MPADARTNGLVDPRGVAGDALSRPQTEPRDHAEERLATAARWAVGCWLCRASDGGAAQDDLILVTTIEVKHDLQAATSGELTVEIACRGRASGLSATGAAWWALVVGREVLVVPVIRLLAAINAGCGRTIEAGDERATVCVLVPQADVRRLALFTLPAGDI